MSARAERCRLRRAEMCYQIEMLINALYVRPVYCTHEIFIGAGGQRQYICIQINLRHGASGRKMKICIVYDKNVINMLSK